MSHPLIAEVGHGRLAWHEDDLVFDELDTGKSWRDTDDFIAKVGPHGYIHGWIKVSDLGEDGIGMSDDQAEDMAAKMTAGKSPGTTKLANSVKFGAQLWSNGNDSISPYDQARFRLVVHHAKPVAPTLYRGVSTGDYSRHDQKSYVQSLIAAKPGDVIKSDRAASWSAKEKVAHEFAGIQHESFVSSLYSHSVVIRVQPGAHALPIMKHVSPVYAQQEEWVSPPSSYEVVSNEPHPAIPGVHVVTVKEVPSDGGH